MNPSSKSAALGRVIFGPCLSFQIQNAGWDMGGFDAIVACHKVVLNEMNLGLYDGKFVTEVSESVISASVPLNFCGCVPVVEVGDSVMEGVVGWGWTIEESIEPDRDQLGDINR
jgi:hypothetical protein